MSRYAHLPRLLASLRLFGRRGRSSSPDCEVPAAHTALFRLVESEMDLANAFLHLASAHESPTDSADALARAHSQLKSAQRHAHELEGTEHRDITPKLNWLAGRFVEDSSRTP